MTIKLLGYEHESIISNAIIILVIYYQSTQTLEVNKHGYTEPQRSDLRHGTHREHCKVSRCERQFLALPTRAAARQTFSLTSY